MLPRGARLVYIALYYYAKCEDLLPCQSPEWQVFYDELNEATCWSPLILKNNLGIFTHRLEPYVRSMADFEFHWTRCPSLTLVSAWLDLWWGYGMLAEDLWAFKLERLLQHELKATNLTFAAGVGTRSAYNRFRATMLQQMRHIGATTTVSIGCSRIVDLSLHEWKVFSQDGMDGILSAIFETIGTTSKYYVEIGTQTGHECNSRFWRQRRGWNGAMLDDHNHNIHVRLFMHFVEPENINRLFGMYGVLPDLDLLSIDINGGDVKLWDALEPGFSPRVVVIEVTVDEWPALASVAKRKGYAFVHYSRPNAVFVRSDVAFDASQCGCGGGSPCSKGAGGKLQGRSMPSQV